MKRINRNWLLAIALAVTVTGCAGVGQVTVEKAYKNYGRFVGIQASTVGLTEDPLVDKQVKDAAAKAVVAAKPYADMFYDAANEVAKIQDEIKALKAENKVVPESMTLLLLEKQAKLRELYLSNAPRVRESISIVQSLRY